MENKKLEEILELVKSNPTNFRNFSNDKQQINPEARISSISEILKNLELQSNSTVLDIATGYGYGAILLNALGYNVIGIEFNKNKLDEGLSYWEKLNVKFSIINNPSDSLKTNGELYFMCRDARNLEDFPDCSIDMITSFYISGYMVGRNGPFKDVERILKPKTNLIITTEGPRKVPKLFRRLIVDLMSRLYAPQNFTYTKIIDIDNPKVYDRYLIIMEK